MNILDRICHDKREHIARQKRLLPEARLHEEIVLCLPVRPFAGALKTKIAAKQTAIIAELKKASPSKGLIREDFNISDLAIAYEKGGATCLSVLTDEPYFQGKDDYVRQAKAVTGLPVIRKDFILDPYQVLESRALSADCILLIMAALEDNQAHECYQAAKEYGMDVLVEVHDEAECERALRLEPDLLGINNRSLKTFEVDIETTLRIARHVPRQCSIICESGIYTADDIRYIETGGVYGFLIGESLMRQNNLEQALRALLHSY
ncbi:MAG: indole-3-glycerol phosphate synthase TrpC [Alphaproteobacteria bacterium]|nr:indole-3-glycerol phosphate synthase TrpC [Alphaproteobacteria bacterium]